MNLVAYKSKFITMMMAIRGKRPTTTPAMNVMRDALEFYANMENYAGHGLDFCQRPVWVDGGERARVALGRPLLSDND